MHLGLSQKPSKIVPKPLQILSWDLFFSMELNLNFKCVVTSSKMTSKNCSRASKSLPNLSQKLPKTLPKPSQNPFKNAIKKIIVWRLVLFQNFLFFLSKSMDLSYAFKYVSNPKFTLKSMPFLTYFSSLFSWGAKKSIL